MGEEREFDIDSRYADSRGGLEERHLQQLGEIVSDIRHITKAMEALVKKQESCDKVAETVRHIESDLGEKHQKQHDRILEQMQKSCESCTKRQERVEKEQEKDHAKFTKTTETVNKLTWAISLISMITVPILIAILTKMIGIK